MDAADAYVELYDTLVRCDLPHLSDWSVTQDVQDIADQIRSEVEAQGELPDHLWNTWLPEGPACTAQALGVLLGLDRALLNADRARDTLANRALGHLRARLEMYGRLNEETSGRLLFRRAKPSRPNHEPQSLDGFLNLIRIPPHIDANITIVLVSEVRDLPDLEDDEYSGELQPLPQLPTAQLPILAEATDLVWDIKDDHPPYKYYSVRPNNSALTPHIRRALDQLDASGAVLALLPEASLDDHLLDRWLEALRRKPRPGNSRLTWLLVGTGPVTSHGGQVLGDRPPNRAVLLHRCGELLLTHDKQHGFSFAEEQQHEYGIDLGCTRDEYISFGRNLSVLEARHGRFAVHICEDLAWHDTQGSVISSGVTHLMVPVLAAAMWERGWQAENAIILAQEAGTDVAVSNGLAIQRYSPEGGPAPTLLVCSVPPGPHLNYLKRQQLVRAFSSRDVADPRVDALTVREGPW